MVNKDDLETILARALEETKGPDGRVNLSEIARRTGITRSRLRKWKNSGFHILPDMRGKYKRSRKIDLYTWKVDELLKDGTTNSVVIMNEIMDFGFDGKLTIVKDYIAAHKDLVPPARIVGIPHPEVGRRWHTEAGDCYQMDWGFVEVEDELGNHWQCACFVMVCHHCGYRYIEFFPNARQENLFIGMLHAFSLMGVPQRVLTDNMKSVTLGRDAMGNVTWNAEYDRFQQLLGFKTDLCKVAHPFTKGRVERLVRYIKGNFIKGRTFLNVNDLNRQALVWCADRNARPTSGTDYTPSLEHHKEGTRILSEDERPLLLPYLAPRRNLSFDRFVEYEGRRYGVPLPYTRRSVRVMRDREKLSVLDSDDFHELASYTVDWSGKDKTCPGQWDLGAPQCPQEKPTAPVHDLMRIKESASDVQSDVIAGFSILAELEKEARHE